jgi:hypothetical protein
VVAARGSRWSVLQQLPDLFEGEAESWRSTTPQSPSPQEDASSCDRSRGGRAAGLVQDRISAGCGSNRGAAMTTQTVNAFTLSLFGQAGPPPCLIFRETEIELWPYRRRTVALLRRYARASVEVGRLPSMLGREFFRSRVTSYTMRNFEDVVIFVTDMEQAIEKLDGAAKKLLAMNIIEEYTIPEVSRLLSCNQRTAERLIQDALDKLSRILLEGGMLESCQEGKNYKVGVSGTKQGRNKI